LANRNGDPNAQTGMGETAVGPLGAFGLDPPILRPKAKTPWVTEANLGSNPNPKSTKAKTPWVTRL